MVFVLGFPAVIALAIGFELGGGYAQEQTVARPYGFAIPRGVPAGTYMLLNPGQGRGPMYAILDGVRSPSMPAGTTEGRGLFTGDGARGLGMAAGTTEGRGLFTGGDSAMIWDSPREGSPMQPASPPAIQVVQAPSEQSVPMAQPAAAAQPLRMMRPAAVEAVQAPSVQIVQRNVPVAEVAEVSPVVAPVQIVQRNVPVAEVAPVVAPVVAEPAPVVPAQAPVQQSAQIIAPAEHAPAPVAIQAPVQQARATADEPEEPEEPESAPVRAIQPSVQQPREEPEPAPARAIQPPVQQPREEPEPAPVRAIQPPVQQPREPVPEPNRAPVPEPNRAPVRAQQPARQPARATPIPVRASIQQPASDATVRIAQAPTGQARTLLTSIMGDITGTATTDTASPTGGATTTPTGTTTTTNGKTTTTNGKTTTTNGKTTLPTAIPGSAVSLAGQTDRLLITMVLGFVGYELFL